MFMNHEIFTESSILSFLTGINILSENNDFQFYKNIGAKTAWLETVESISGADDENENELKMLWKRKRP